MSVLAYFANSKLIDEAQAFSPKRFQGLEPRKSAHSKDLGCPKNANKAKEPEYAEYAEVRDNHEYVSPASSDEGLEIWFPAVLDNQVGNEDTKQPKLNARWNQIGLGNACKEYRKPNYGYPINKAVPHVDKYSKINQSIRWS